jgi:arginine/ornithine transport system substrate-binding protein
VKFQKYLSALILSLFVGQVVAMETLKVGLDPNLKPFAYMDERGQVAGFDVEIAREVCADLKRECVFVPMEWDGLIPALGSGKIDAVISAMSITEAREKVVDFTRPYYKSPSQLLRLKDRARQLYGSKVGVLRGSTDEAYARGELVGVNVVAYGNQNEALFDLAAGRVDSVLGPRLELLAGVEDAGQFVFVGPLLDDPEYFGPGIGMAIKEQRPDLLAALNRSINDMRRSGRWQAISDRYFDVDLWAE